MKTSKKVKKKRERDPLAGDLSHLLDQPGWRKTRYEFKIKNKTITLRISESLLEAIKEKAQHEGVDYQRWIRLSLEECLHKSA
jgi:predicted DNA binding CopG/RHH family protein